MKEMDSKLEISENSRRVLEKRYLKKDIDGKVAETAAEMFRRVVNNIARADKNYERKSDLKKAEEEFYSIISSLEFLPNSPTLMNAGRELQQLSACFVLPVRDSMEGIFDSLKSAALIHKSGGGTGFSFSNLRPKNSVVRSTGGVASGPVSFMKVFDSATQAVKQGGTRRGANMGILSVDHPDILEFITCKENDKDITNFNISVMITDEFMKKVEEKGTYSLIDPHSKKKTGELNAREVFDLIIKMAWKNGEPGIIFGDRINRDNPTPKIGAIESTNPCGEQPLLPYESCMAKDTRITTDQGIEPVEKLYERQKKGETIFIATQSENEIVFRPAKIIYTKKKPVFKITLSNGQGIRLTEDHKVLTPKGFKQVKDLIISKDKIVIQNKISGEVKFSMSKKTSRLYQMLGWFSGDGWFTDKKTFGLTFGPEDEYAFDALVPAWQDFTASEAKAQTQKNFVRCVSSQKQAARKKFLDLGFCPNKGPKKRVPSTVFTTPKQLQIAYIQGLFCADGSAYPKKPQFYFSSSSLRLLQDVQLLLLNMEMYSNIKFYPVRPRGRHQGSLRIYGKNLVRFMDLVDLPLSPIKRKKVSEQLEKTRHFYNAKDAVTVVSIEPDGIDDVYDVHEPVTHTLIAEGMIIHNCNLGSINLARMVSGGDIDWAKLARTVKIAVHFLDNVIDMNKFPLAIIREKTLETRKIGLGVMGFADTLIKLGIPYDSDEALEKAEEVMKFILKNAERASEELAEKRGPFPAFKNSVYCEKKRPLRNATLTTIAPTGTLSIIANCSSGIEPIFAISYIRNVMDNDELVEVHPLFLEIAKERGFYSDELMKRIAKEGSIQNFEEIPDDVKRLFRISLDIKPEYHIRMQGVFQKYTHNAVSKTINFPNKASADDVKDAYMLAYKNGCKGITIYRDKSREEQVLNIGKAEKENTPVKEREAVDLKPKPRNSVIYGTTTKVSTGCGNLYVTINNDEIGQPFEVFMQMGKAGGCAMSQLEAIGRLVSLALRSGVNVNSVIDQLKGIRCPSPSWEKGGGRIFSCSDAIARVVERRMSKVKELEKKELVEDINYLDSSLDDSSLAEEKSTKGGAATKTKTGSVVGVCPDCGAALRHIEGCQVCSACGFSKC